MASDVVDDINALLKLDAGDPFRLEHIKQAYILNNTIWKSDDRYLEQLREKYLVKHQAEQHDAQPEIVGNLESGSENKNGIHCWKCGKKNLFEANFCMVCGISLFEVSTKSKTRTVGLKIPIMIGIPVLILVILGVGFSQGFLDNAIEKQVLDDSVESEIDSVDSSDEEILPTENNSKCGAGTIYDPETNSCILDK